MQPVAAAWMAAIEDGHVVLLSHNVDGTEKGEEVLLGIYVFFAMGGEEDVASFLETEALVNVGGFNLSEVLVKDFSHR